MKLFVRLTVAFAVLMMTATMLAGCAGQGNIPQDDPQNTVSEGKNVNVSVVEMYSQISTLGVLPDMFMLDDAYISGYYGIAEDLIEDKVFMVADDPLKADTIIIVKALDESKSAEMVNAFNIVNNQRMFELESYNPEQYARVENAVIKSSGAYVYYIVSDDNDAVVKAIEEHIG